MIRVTCAIIRNEENEVLVVQRGKDTDHPLKWEFPGGKLRNGESEEECIAREIMEELSMEIVICSRMAEVGYDYGIKQILLIPFICDTLDDLPVLSEHFAFKWLTPDKLMSVDLLEADILVALNYLDTIAEKTTHNNAVPAEEETVTDETALKGMVNRLMGMKEAEWVALSAVENPAIFRKLVDYSFLPESRLAFRASWTLSKACDKSPEMINPFLDEIIVRLHEIENESVLRSFLRIISFYDIEKLSERLHGILAELCFSKLHSATSAIAVKAYSMEILYKLACIYPELLNELYSTVNMLQGEGSAGIVARGRMILKKLGWKSEGRGSSQT